MDLETLKVSNEIYGLELTKEDFDLLESEIDRLSFGVLYLLERKGKEYGISYDRGYGHERNKVIINDKATMVGRGKYPVRVIEEMKFTFNMSPDDADAVRFHLRNSFFKRQIDSKSVFSSVQEFKTIIKQIMMKAVEDKQEHDVAKVTVSLEGVPHWFWLFDDKGSTELLLKDMQFTDLIHTISKVWEYKNHRFSLATTRTADNFKVMCFSTKDVRYNYIDVGRKFSHMTYIMDDLPLNEIDFDFLKLCAPNQTTFAIVNRARYQEVVKINKLKIQREKEEKEMMTLVKKETEKRFERLSIEPLTIKGITFSNKMIALGDQQISGKISDRKTRETWGSKDFSILSFIKDNVNLENINDIDFNDLYNRFCERLDDREFDGVLGNIPVRVKRETRTNSENSTISKWTINGVRINKEEIVEMLKRAICFESVPDYDKLLKQVSKCSLLFHDMLNQGLHFLVYEGNHFGGDGSEKTMKLQVVRVKNHNYVQIGDNKFRIKNTSKLISRSSLNRARRHRSFSLEDAIAVFASDVFEPRLSATDIAFLIREGFKEYLLALKRSEEFLRDAVKATGAQEAEFMNSRGWAVQGISGKDYFLTKDSKVYDMASKSYICIVDKTVSSSFANDRLVARLFALRNDKLVARNINTLGLNAK